LKKPRNAIAELRDRLRLNQQKFGEAVGRSAGLVRQLEAGLPPSPGVQQRLVELAEQYGYGDLVDDFLADREEPRRMGDLPRQIFQPRQIAETSAGRRLAAIETVLDEIKRRLAALETRPCNKDGK